MMRCEVGCGERDWKARKVSGRETTQCTDYSHGTLLEEEKLP